MDGERGKGPRQIRAGDVLGRYEIGDELGEGGMATVFRARDRELRRDVAVKVLFPHLARRPEIVRRFHREARAAAGLEHPNILRVYDVGGAEGDDPPYIVMELVRGRTLLAEIEARGAMLAEVAAAIGAVLADALAVAHAAGVIHRDVKPANVLIAPDGRLLLADFGVARLETEDSLVTRTGALLGTPAYMSPEQASGDVATAKSDLYSLGATVYQLATGTLPYAGAPARVLSLIATGQLVPPVRRRPACGGELSRLVVAAMASDPAARPASARALAVELRGLVTASGLGDPADELVAYFADPEGFAKQRTPVVVASLVRAANAAIADDKLPRAMGLADRASALAPDEPAVAALIREVIAGGRASRRRRWLTIAGIAAVGAGGTAALAAMILREPAVTREAVVARDAMTADATAVVIAKDAAIAIDAAVELPPDATPSSDARTVERARRDAGASDAGKRDTGATEARDAGASDAGVSDAGVSDAGVIDAAPDAPLAPAHVIVHNDLWCNVWIDGVDRGSRRNEALEVPAGHHTVRCVNPAGEWSLDVDVAPGATRTLTGSVRRPLVIKLDIDATIDGAPHPQGAELRLKSGVVHVVAAGKDAYFTIRDDCTIRAVPALGCYP